MKRKFTMMFISALFLTATSVVARVLSFVPLGFWANFGIGSGLLVVGLLLLVFCGKHNAVKCVVTVINALSMGCYLRSWYINRGFDNSLWLMLFVVALATIYYLVAILPMAIPAVEAKKGLYLTLFVIASVVLFVLLVIFTKTTWVSTLGYFGLIQLGFVICLALDEKQKIYNAMVASTYTVAICAVIILIVVLSASSDGGGSILDGLDIPSGDGKKSKKSHK